LFCESCRYAPNAAGLPRLGATGFVSIVNVTVSNTLQEGVRIEGKAKGSGLALTLADVRLTATAHYDPGLGNKASKSINPVTVVRVRRQLRHHLWTISRALRSPRALCCVLICARPYRDSASGADWCACDRIGA